MILGVIRDHSDAVLVGAASVRAEGYVVPRHAALAVVTGSGDFTGHRIVRSRGRLGELVILCPAAAAATARRTLGTVDARIIVVPDLDGRLAPTDILAALRSAGFASIACEGGPSLAAQFADAGLLDEICLTTTPMVNGGALPLFGAHAFADRRLTLTQLLKDEADCLYARWAVVAD
jgi:riboflavin biosynthesis pyrimidine reductase